MTSLLGRLDEVVTRARSRPVGSREEAKAGRLFVNAWPQIQEALVAAVVVMRYDADSDDRRYRLDVALRPFFPLPCVCGHEDGDHLGGGDRECAAEGCECMEYDPGDPVRPELRP